MNINLRELREKAQRRDDNGKPKAITRDELAVMLASQMPGKKIHPTQIARYEDEPGTTPMDMLLPWLRCLGTTLEEQLLAYSKTQAETRTLDPGTPYAKLDLRREMLKEYVSASAKWAMADEGHGLPTVADLNALIERIGRKPNIALSGAYDAGKSTLANWLLSSQSLVESYQPTTAAVTYVRHIDDRPEWLQDTVVLLTDRFDPARWNEKKHVMGKCHLGSGGLELLKEGATHRYGSKAEPAGNALVFLDSPILRACNIIDHPGFQNDTKDDQRAERAFRDIDVLIFASPVGGFMSSPDLVILREFLRRMPIYEKVSDDFPTLANLYIVATHAGPQLSNAQLFGDASEPGLLNIGAGRIWRELQEGELAARATQSGRHIDDSVIRSRIFPFWRENGDRSAPLSEAILALLSQQIPQCAESEANQQVDGFRKSAVKHVASAIDFYQSALDDMEKMRASYEKKLEAEGDRKQQRKALQTKLFALIQKSKAAHLQECTHLYADRINPVQIEAGIRKRYKDKKEAQQLMGNYLYSGLQEDLQHFGSERAEQVAQLVEGYLATYGHAIELDGDSGEHAVSIPFDARGSFIGGFAGLGSVGALTLWASSLGNLGGYIIAAKAVSILSALGIGVGGTASAMAGVAALGGPVSLIIALGVAIIYLFKALFGDDWQTRLAKQLFDHFKKNTVEAKLAEGIRDYWDQSQAAFEQGALQVEQDYQAGLQDLEQFFDDPERLQQAERAVASLGKTKEFFAGLPGFYGKA